MGLYRVTVSIHKSVIGGVGSNTWHVRSTDTPGDGAQLDALVGRLFDFYEAIDAAFVGGTRFDFDGVFVGVGAQEDTVVVGDPQTYTTTNSDASMPPSQCIVVNWVGSSGDRSKRGRTFLGPLHQDVNENDGTILGATLGTIRAEAALFVESFDGGGDGAFVVWSRQENVGRDIVSSNVQDQFGSLRSRRD